jgi:thioredoxin reductase (NADPH)
MVKGVYDLVVLGTGPAGMAAAIYAGRYDLKTLVIGKEVGGMTNLAGEIENYPGFIGSGIDLMKKFEEQAKMFGAEFLNGNIDKLEKSKEGFRVEVGGKEYAAKAVISGLGSEHRKLGIPGEDEFLGKGVSYCATCDGNFFRGKTVAVVGGSDSAAKAAIYLSSICKKVYVSYRKERMRAEPINLAKVEEAKNIEIVYNTKPVEIVGEAKVSGLKLEATDGGENKVLDVDGVFIEIGSTPITQIVEGLGVELEKGYIKVDKEGRTNVAGLFAAGDGTNNPFKQAITAAADGSLAAKAAYNFVKLGK